MTPKKLSPLPKNATVEEIDAWLIEYRERQNLENILLRSRVLGDPIPEAHKGKVKDGYKRNTT